MLISAAVMQDESRVTRAQRMPRVVIESPFAGDVAANVAYAERCVLDSLCRGEAPYASHLFFTRPGLLDDLDPAQRELGIEAGLAWGLSAELVAVYVDRDISQGMRLGVGRHLARHKPVVVRTIERMRPSLLSAFRRELEIAHQCLYCDGSLPDDYESGRKCTWLATHGGGDCSFDRARSPTPRPTP